MKIRLRLLPSDHALSVPAGERLLDVADDHPELGFALACRAANCGACRVEVVRGGECLLPASEREREQLLLGGCAPTERLGCQLRLKSGLELRAAAAELVLRLPQARR